jgi:hypothetical protein
MVCGASRRRTRLVGMLGTLILGTALGSPSAASTVCNALFAGACSPEPNLPPEGSVGPPPNPLPIALILEGDGYYAFLGNADLAASKTFGVAGIAPDGSMTWATAQRWISAMNAAQYLGASDWRLPNGPQVNPICNANCSGSEMGSLFYDVLEGSAGSRISDIHDAYFNDVFSNIQNGTYWTGTTYAPNATSAWAFDFSNGGELTADKANYSYFVWPIRLNTPIVSPEPSTGLLVIAGLLGFAGWRRARA